MTERLEAVEGNLIVLQQGVDVLSRLDDLTYATGGGDPETGRSPAGVHFRHVFDHYHAFLAGLADDAIDYDVRRRQTAVEQDRQMAIAMALGLAGDLGRLPPALGDRSIRVSARSVANYGTEPDWSVSSLKRELQFLVSHTVHHYALIKECLHRAGFDAGNDFGVAPSTIAALRQGVVCAQ